MSFVITQSCCNDASCIPVCPVSCIRPTPDDPDFLTSEMLYIDPKSCIDCGACMDVCPVGAIYPEEELPESLDRYADINAAYFDRNPITEGLAPAAAPISVPRGEVPWRVAIVGSGPAGTFAAAELMARVPGVEIEMFDRLPTPWGLARAGVAPDHWETKEISEVFRRTASRPGFAFHLNVEVGKDLSHEELMNHHHAVIYATGAMQDRTLGVPGDDLPGSVAAIDFVAWYNGHPDFSDRAFDLTGSRAVVVGNGNVALDVARILLTDPETLAHSDISDRALNALRTSSITEVVVLGRRGVAQASYTTPELMALAKVEGVEVVVEGASPVHAEGSFAVELKQQVATEYAAASSAAGAAKKLVLRHLTSPVRIIGEDSVTGIELVRNELVADEDQQLQAVATDDTSELVTSLVIRAVGFRSAPVPGVPFDDSRNRFPHSSGRILDERRGGPVPGVYVTGWAKRGASGVIGTNKRCAAETVDALVQDLLAGSLPAPSGDRAALTQRISELPVDSVDRQGWLAIEKHERTLGASQGRPRVKVVDRTALVALARQGTA